MHYTAFGKSRLRLAAIVSLIVLGGAAFTTSSLVSAQEKRQKVIDFDDEVVEGLNKQPLDSLNEIADRAGKHKRTHLYLKRTGFKSENAETLHAIRYTP